MKTTPHIQSRESGFTLVELAIVMIIIGLLIGGILKGQELIQNARIASTVAQLKGIDASVSTFRDSYQSLAGDMANAQTRLPNCGNGGFCFNGTGDSTIGTPVAPIDPNGAGAGAVAAANAAGEPANFWKHLAAADLLNGVNATNAPTWGEAFPAANIGGGFVMGQTGNGAITNATAGAAVTARGGMYVVIRSSVATPASGTAGQGLFGPQAAARIDRKMDDGAPNGGTVRAIGPVGAGAAGCADVNTAAGVYNEGTDQSNCSLAVRIQQ